MSGYELNDKDIEIVLESLQRVQPDATREDAVNLLLKTKMEVRELAQTDPDQIEDMLENLREGTKE